MTDYWTRAKQAYEDLQERKKQEAVDEFKAWFGDDVPVTGTAVRGDTVLVCFTFNNLSMTAMKIDHNWIRKVIEGDAPSEEHWFIEADGYSGYGRVTDKDAGALFIQCQAIKKLIDANKKRFQSMPVEKEYRPSHKSSLWQRLWN